MQPKVILPVRMPPDLKRWIGARARRAKETPSRWAWQALEAYRQTYRIQEEIEAQQPKPKRR